MIDYDNIKLSSSDDVILILLQWCLCLHFCLRILVRIICCCTILCTIGDVRLYVQSIILIWSILDIVYFMLIRLLFMIATSFQIKLTSSFLGFNNRMLQEKKLFIKMLYCKKVMYLDIVFVLF